MHDLAKVSVIQSITPIEGKDRIVLAKVENYNSIVNKDEFKVGDKCVYVFYDAVLPETEAFEFLRKRCWSEKLHGFRIRPMKMGGVISEGLVLPLSVLPEGREFKVGDVVTETLGIRAYETEEVVKVKPKGFRRFLYRFPIFRRLLSRNKPRREYPPEIPKSDEENIEKVWDNVKGKELSYYVTEKVEGQAATYIYRKGKLSIYSHNIYVGNTGSWGAVASSLDLKGRLARYVKKHGLKGIVVQGEIVGPGIQKNIYGLSAYRFFVYTLRNLDGSRILSLEANLAFAAETGLEFVPVLARSEKVSGLEDMLKASEGTSLITKGVPREGVVWVNEETGIHFKVKSRPYKVWFEERKNPS